MSNNNQNQNPITPEAVRHARHAGFHNSLLHKSEESRNKLKASYTKQDANRERFVSTFVNEIAGGK